MLMAQIMVSPSAKIEYRIRYRHTRDTELSFAQPLFSVMSR